MIAAVLSSWYAILLFYILGSFLWISAMVSQYRASILSPSIEHPFIPRERLFFTLDFTHNFKILYNSLLNK